MRRTAGMDGGRGGGGAGASAGAGDEGATRPRRGRHKGDKWTPLVPDAPEAPAAAAGAYGSGASGGGGGADGTRRVGRHGVSMGARGVYDVRNTLNDLTRGEWRAFSQAIVANQCGPLDAYGVGEGGDHRAHGAMEHPDRFPDGLAERMILFFTKRGGSVLDPFAGTGGTLTACDRLGRKGMGIELYEKWASVARNRTRQRVVCADAMDAAEMARGAGGRGGGANGGGVDMILTGLPRYVPSVLRMTKGRHIPSGIDPADVSHADTYGQYLDGVADRLAVACGMVRPGGHAVVVAQNEIGWAGRCIPAAFDIAGRVGGLEGMRFLGEKLWLEPRQQWRAFSGASDRAGAPQEPMWGYPHRYAAGTAGAGGALYCMVFRRLAKRRRRRREAPD